MITMKSHHQNILPHCQQEQTLKPLPLHFSGRGEVRGFQFYQILVSDRAYCYQAEVEGVLYYHVFRRAENRQYLTISYPGPKAFGVWAWVYRFREKAEQKFQFLSKKGD